MMQRITLPRSKIYRRLAVVTLAAVITSLLPRAKAADDAFPTKPVKIIVPTTPGGQMDLPARLIGAKLAEYWEVPVIVDNRPGGGIAIGTQAAAKSAPDGYTLLLAHEGAIVVNPTLVENTAYSVSDFEPLAQVWDASMVLAVNKGLSVESLNDLDALMRKNPGKFNYPVAGTDSELMSDMLKQAMRWDYLNVPYKGNAERLRSLMAGETHLMLMNVEDAATAIASGSVRAIGIASATRSPRMPTVPTLDEAGAKGFKLSAWAGLFAPAATPKHVLEKLKTDVRRALSEPDVVERIEVGGNQVVPMTVDQFKQRIASDVAKWRKLADSRGMKTF